MLSAQLLKQGALSSCQTQLFSEIRKDPGNNALRVFLFQLCCVQQDWERAKTQLKVLSDLSETNLALIQTYSQLIECEQIRGRVLDGEQEPTCFGQPLPWLAHYHQAACLTNLEQYQNALQLSLLGAELAKSVSGNIDGSPFQWLTDGDMRFGPALEVMLNNTYYTLPFEYIKSIEFEPIEDLRDVVWRPAHLTLRNKAKFIVFVPSRYPLSPNSTDEQKLARTCDWLEPVAEFFIGQGQRILVSDNFELGILDITKIEFD